jgi:hypothetical protein
MNDTQGKNIVLSQKWATVACIYRNGASTTITFIIFEFQNNVTTIEVQLTNNSTKMIFKKCSFQHKHIYDGLYYKMSFPIVLAYVMTSLKSQGATIA